MRSMVYRMYEGGEVWDVCGLDVYKVTGKDGI